VLSNVDLSHAIANSDLNDRLRGDVVVVAAVAGHDERLADVFRLRQRVEDGLHEVLEVVGLLEHLNLLSEA